MAFRFRGNLSWKRQPGSVGPTLDLTYGLWRRVEEYEGIITEFNAFLAANPYGSFHPTLGAALGLRLVSLEPSFPGAGMGRARLEYRGAPGNATAAGNPPVISVWKTASKPVIATRTYQYVAAYTTNSGGAIISKDWGGAIESIDGTLDFSYLAPSVTFRYARTSVPTGPQYAAQAAVALAGHIPRIVSQTAFRPATSWPSLPTEYQNLKVTLPNLTLTDVVVQPTGGVQANPVLGTDWYELEETHELLFKE